MKRQPLVSVIIPCYNSEDFLHQCILSVLSQSYGNVEVVVVDDGSTDNSLSVASSFENVKLFKQPNSGACVARNRGLRESRGEYVKFLDSDDFLLPGCLDLQVTQSELLPGDAIVYGDFYIKKNGRSSLKSPKIDDLNQTSALVFGNLLISTPLHRRSMLEQVGGFDERLSSGQEWNLHIRLSSQGYKFVHHPKPIFTYRIHDSEHRITNRRYRSKDLSKVEKKLMLTLADLGAHSSGNVEAAFSKAYWWLARAAFRQGDLEFSDHCIKRSIALTEDFKEFWPLYYKVLYSVFGFRFAERIFSIAYGLKSRNYSS